MLREVADPEAMTRARFRAIEIHEDLFAKRDRLLKGSLKDIMRAEEQRKSQRAERWEKAVATLKKRGGKAATAKSPSTP